MNEEAIPAKGEEVGEESRGRSDFGKGEANVVLPAPVPLPDSVLYYGDEEPEPLIHLTDEEQAYCAGEELI